MNTNPRKENFELSKSETYICFPDTEYGQHVVPIKEISLGTKVISGPVHLPKKPKDADIEFQIKYGRHIVIVSGATWYDLQSYLMG